MRECEDTEPLHAVRLACAGIAVRERRGEQGGVEHVLVGVVESRAHEVVAKVADLARLGAIGPAVREDRLHVVPLDDDVRRHVGVCEVEIDVP